MFFVQSCAVCNAETESGVFLCPETMGKYTQMGTVDEIFEICSWSDCLIPTLDFGHINSVMQGALKTKDDFKAIFSDRGFAVRNASKFKYPVMLETSNPTCLS